MLIDTSNNVRSGSLDSVLHSDEVFIIQRRLMTVARTAHSTANHFEYAICNCAIIYTECYLRNVSVNAHIIDILIVRVTRSIEIYMESAVGDPTQQNYYRLMLWAVYLACSVVVERHEAQRLAGYFVQLCGLLKVSSWQDLEPVLRRVLWPRSHEKFDDMRVWSRLWA